HMHGAKVNGRIVPLSYILKNGDIVEIQSSAKLVKGPSRDWVKIVRTATAKSKINAWFKKEARGENITTGKELLGNEISRNGFTPEKLLMHKAIEAILKRNNFSSLDDMYAAIGYGSISVNKVFSRLRDDYIRNCSEEERSELGYRITADGNVVYSPMDLPLELGKIDQNRTGKGKGKTATPETTKQVASYDVTKLGVINTDPHQAASAAAIRAGVKPEDLTEQTKSSKSGASNSARRTHSSDEVIVDGIEAIATHISKCCHPVYGDDIIGFITREKGVGIHKTSCKNIQNIMSRKNESIKDLERYQRLVSVHWLSKAKFSSYDVQLIVEAIDRSRLLLDVLDKINEEKINIVKLNTVVDGNNARIYVTVNISGKEQLDRTVARIETVKDVTGVIRN
ncbi:MAG: bifunctional (p)ppGpp synthetase/guanosine-3',5'-bis(diphosphate) 3'-pyrophosphohydrolase, partial [Clostridiales bacterium]|nr:bifunctional (p)ppGpp synthetase/guanosine-3',5'-bis(diphosphate) 3'-pyrophosphohydrolase [Clostridiales bacterium]